MSPSASQLPEERGYDPHTLMHTPTHSPRAGWDMLSKAERKRRGVEIWAATVYEEHREDVSQ